MTSPIEIREHAGVRTLHFGSDAIQGAMRIARPWHLELDYTREMMVSLLLRDSAHFPRNVLLIGLGAASLTKFLYRHYPKTQLTVIEIEPCVIAAARQFFKLPKDPSRLNIIIADGAQHVVESNQTYDLILLDGYDANCRSDTLNTQLFYQQCRTRLKTNGILVANLLGRNRGFHANLDRIKNTFNRRVLTLSPCDSGNVIALAATGEKIQIPLRDLSKQALDLKQKTRLNLLPTLIHLKQIASCSDEILTI